MDDTRFEIRDRELPTAPPLAIALTYDAAMAELAAWTERFWSQLDANGEGGTRIRLRLEVNEVDRQRGSRVRATSTVSG